MPSSSEFAAELQERVQAGRTFGRHPLWRRIEEGALDLPGLRAFAVQFFLQVREFPRAVSALHSACPDPEERVRLAESVYEEETGRISGCGCSHPELFIRFAESLGLERDACVHGLPLAETRALIDWFELSSQRRPFVEGAAAIALAAEGQVPGAFAPFARALEKHYGLSREAVAFWDVHEEADKEHSDVGDHIVLRLATTEAVQAAVRAAVDRSLGAWWSFFDGIERSVR